LIYRSKHHLHKQTPRLCLIQSRLRPCMTFVVVYAVVRNLLHLSTKKCGALSAKFLGNMHWILFWGRITTCLWEKRWSGKYMEIN